MMNIFNLTNARRVFTKSPVPFARLIKLFYRGIREIISCRKIKKIENKNEHEHENNHDLENDHDCRELEYKY